MHIRYGENYQWCCVPYVPVPIPPVRGNLNVDQ